MKKAMCITDGFCQSPEEVGKPHPTYGEICIITNQKEADGILFYQLKGYHERSGFDSRGFIPLSGKDETEIAAKRLQTA